MTFGTVVYPCDKGTGKPQGFHHFQGNAQGQICCVFCGATPRKPQFTN